MNEEDYALLVETMMAFREQLQKLKDRMEMLERIYGRVMQIQMRVDNLEFVSNIPLDPSIHEHVIDFGDRLEKIESILNIE